MQDCSGQSRAQVLLSVTCSTLGLGLGTPNPDLKKVLAWFLVSVFSCVNGDDTSTSLIRLTVRIQYTLLDTTPIPLGGATDTSTLVISPPERERRSATLGHGMALTTPAVSLCTQVLPKAPPTDWSRRHMGQRVYF